jgi:hypothetical protein
MTNEWMNFAISNQSPLQEIYRDSILFSGDLYGGF